MSRLTYSRPSEISAEAGRVLIDGPEKIEIAMTPEAALETGHRLIDNAVEAAGVEHEASFKAAPRNPR